MQGKFCYNLMAHCVEICRRKLSHSGRLRDSAVPERSTLILWIIWIFLIFLVFLGMYIYSALPKSKEARLTIRKCLEMSKSSVSTALHYQRSQRSPAPTHTNSKWKENIYLVILSSKSFLLATPALHTQIPKQDDMTLLDLAFKQQNSYNSKNQIRI